MRGDAMKKRKSEAGTTYLLLALLAAGLLGMAALAIDSAVIMTERRHAQNAADASALAAAYTYIKGGYWGTAALDRAASNEYVTTAQQCNPAGLDCLLGVGDGLEVQVSTPPRSGVYVGDPEYVQVTIHSQVDTNFAQLVFSGPLENTSESVVRMRPTQSITPGYALYATTPHDCKGVWFSGTGDTIIDGGGVFSRSDAASASCQSGVQDGSGTITVNPPDLIEVVGTFDVHDPSKVSPNPTENATAEYLPPVPLPNCVGMTNHGKAKINAGEVTSLSPGIYDEITVLSGTVTFNPGMYCIFGTKGFTGNGGTIGGDGVFFYLTNGPFDLGGNTLVNLNAEPNVGQLVDPDHNDWKGMLLYMSPSNTSPLVLTGTSNTTYTGTVYAPNAEVTIAGTGDSIGLSSQVIGYKVKITGSALVDIHYEENKNYELPPAIDLAK
jgi:hypothetical protein